MRDDRNATGGDHKKLKFAIVGLAALCSLAAAGSASAMPLAPHSIASNVENVAMVCGPNGCVRRAPIYRGYGYGVVTAIAVIAVIAVIAAIVAIVATVPAAMVTCAEVTDTTAVIAAETI